MVLILEFMKNEYEEFYEELITPIYTLFCLIKSIGKTSMGYKTLFEQIKAVCTWNSLIARSCCVVTCELGLATHHDQLLTTIHSNCHSCVGPMTRW